MINENVSFESRFRFKVVNENDIQCEILNLNSKKPGTLDNIPTKILTDSSEVCNVIFQNIWNSELLEKQYFPDNLKLADITPVYKKKDPTLVENFSSYTDEFLSSYTCGYRKGFNCPLVIN